MKELNQYKVVFFLANVMQKKVETLAASKSEAVIDAVTYMFFTHNLNYDTVEIMELSHPKEDQV